MNKQVLDSIDELKLQFPNCGFILRDDEMGGVYVLIDGVSLGARYVPEQTWLGFHIPPLYPYADIYPVFVGGEVKRADAIEFVAPVSPGHTFESRTALQISRRTNTVAAGKAQKATTKVLKILDFLERLP